MNKKIDKLQQEINELKEVEKMLKKINKMKAKNELLELENKTNKKSLEKEVIKVTTNILTDEQKYKIKFYDDLKEKFESKLNLELTETEIDFLIAYIQEQEEKNAWYTRFKELN